MIEKIVRKIVDQAKSKYILKRLELRQEWENKGYTVLFAHELCSCPKKREFSTLFPELRDAISLKPSVMIGELIELAIKTLMNLEGIDTHKIVGKYVIFGGIDMYDPETNAVFDIKYTSGEPQPKEEHELRVAVYKWLLDTDKGYLIYISPKGFREFEVKRTLSDEDILDLIESEKSPMWKNECNLCIYKEFCNLAVRSESKEKKIEKLDAFGRR